MVRATTHSISPFSNLGARGEATETAALCRGVLDLSVRPNCPQPTPPWPWPDPGLSQDCCPLCHASPCWLWSGDCRYNVDCSQCVFKDQNNNGIYSAHSRSLIIQASLSLAPWSHQVCLGNIFFFFLASFALRETETKMSHGQIRRLAFCHKLWCILCEF